MALTTFKCNHLMLLPFKGLTWLWRLWWSIRTRCERQVVESWEHWAVLACSHRPLPS